MNSYPRDIAPDKIQVNPIPDDEMDDDYAICYVIKFLITYFHEAEPKNLMQWETFAESRALAVVNFNLEFKNYTEGFLHVYSIKEEGERRPITTTG